MLFRVAALLLTSVMLVLLTGVFVVPASSSAAATPTVTVAVQQSMSSAPDASESAPASRVLRELSALPSTNLREYFGANPDAVSTLLAAPPAAREVTQWWSALDARSRSAMRTASPELVGNLEGIPFIARDLANRTMLDSTTRHLQATVAGSAGRTVKENARQQLAMLESIESALDASPTDRALVSLDVTGQGRAAIVIGDLLAADYVTYLVPGMFFTIEGQMGDWTEAAARLYTEQVDLLAEFESVTTKIAATRIATVAWIGYPTPNLTNVGAIDNAYVGRDALAQAVQGLQAVRVDDEPHLAIVAHSYGTTAALLALTEYDLEVDAVALVGSPGSPAESVDELHVREGNVFVGEAAWDPVPNSSFFGSDPGAAEYGSKRLGVAGFDDPTTGTKLLGSSGHNEYFSPGTESMRNFALIGIGRESLVTDGAPLSVAKASAASR